MSLSYRCIIYDDKVIGTITFDLFCFICQRPGPVHTTLETFFSFLVTPSRQFFVLFRTLKRKKKKRMLWSQSLDQSQDKEIFGLRVQGLRSRACGFVFADTWLQVQGQGHRFNNPEFGRYRCTPGMDSSEASSSWSSAGDSLRFKGVGCKVKG